MMLRIYLDHQRTRNQYRVRIMEGKDEYLASYYPTKSEALKAKKFARKIIHTFCVNDNTKNKGA